jgi:DNA polymerase-3 subunit gamma/tau
VLAGQAERWGLQTIVTALQILSETKTKMFRTTSARALAEMALVRISYLEGLEELSRLIRELKGGASTASAPRPRLSAGPHTSRPETGVPYRPRAGGAASTPPPSPPNQRESQHGGSQSLGGDFHGQTGANEGDQTTGQGGISEQEADLNRVSATPTKVDFRPGNEDAIWSEVLSQINDILRDHVRVVKHTAISGPNQLDLVFPRSYHFSKQYCERGEVRSRLEKLLGQISGRPVTIICRLADAEKEAKPQAGHPQGARDTAREGIAGNGTEPIGDPYVEQAKSIFGATILKKDIMKSASQEES